MAYIYKITDLTNNMIYIGETTQTIQTRWSGHLYKSRHNKDNSYLHNAIRAHGENNFIIEEVDNRDPSLGDEYTKIYEEEVPFEIRIEKGTLS